MKTGKTVWLDPHERGEFYIPRIYWTSRPDTLAMIVLNRQQNDMKLLFFDVTTGGSRPVMEETSKTWIDVYDFYAGVQDLMSFPEKSHEFFWVSDRDGLSAHLSIRLFGQAHSTSHARPVERHAHRRHRCRARRRSISPPPNPTPLERQLWQVKFDGTDLERITTTPGRHSIDMSPNAQLLHRHLVVDDAAATGRAVVDDGRQAAHDGVERADDAMARDARTTARRSCSASRRATA